MQVKEKRERKGEKEKKEREKRKKRGKKREKKTANHQVSLRYEKSFLQVLRVHYVQEFEKTLQVSLQILILSHEFPCLVIY